MRIALAIVMVLGCSSSAAEPGEALGSADASNAPALDASPGIPAIVQSVRPPAIEEMQRDLGRTLEVAVLARAEQPSSIAWALPTCATTYAFAAAVRVQDMEEAAPNQYAMGAFVAGSATMRASDGALAIVRYGRTESGILRDATKQSLAVEPEGTHPDTRLRILEGAWTEVDGPTELWSNYGSMPALAMFFPALPIDGTKARWAIVVPEDEPKTLHADVKLEGWLDVAGVPTAVLTATWTDVVAKTEDGAEMKGQTDYEARYAVLATGRLLFARLRATMHIAATFEHDGETNTLKQRHQTAATAALTDACDGPVLPAAAVAQ